MKIYVESYEDDPEYHRKVLIEVPDDITCTHLLWELKRLLVMLGYAVESINEDWEMIDDL